MYLYERISTNGTTVNNKNEKDVMIEKDIL